MQQDERPEGARVTMNMLGSSAEPQSFAWTERDTMIYALGVGAGSSELQFTTENSEGFALTALPSFIAAMTLPCRPEAYAQLDRRRFLHGEQSISLSRPLPTSGLVYMQPRIEALVDLGQGKGAILRNVVTVRSDTVDGPVIGHTCSSLFVKGAGGFGGPAGGPATTMPDRSPDARIVDTVSPELHLLYRLSGDRHPLHNDPVFARACGFERPILHGLCTYGFACRALLKAGGQDAGALREMNARFRKPVYPGDTLTTEFWLQQDGSALFRVVDGAGDGVIEGGSANFAA